MPDHIITQFVHGYRVTAFCEDDLLDLSAVMALDMFCVPEAGEVVVD